MTIHRGGKDGPVIATGDPCLEKEGQTDIHFLDPKTTILLKHKHHKLPQHIHSMSSFETDSQKYHWKGHNELIDEQSNSVVATFKPTWLEGEGHKIGDLNVLKDKLMDIAVITALIVQERSDEHSLAVKPSYPKKC